VESKYQSSRLAEFGGRGMSFNICSGTDGDHFAVMHRTVFTVRCDYLLPDVFLNAKEGHHDAPHIHNGCRRFCKFPIRGHDQTKGNAIESPQASVLSVAPSRVFVP